MNVLLGITGGIAAYKAADLASALVKNGHSVRVVLTTNASRFVGQATFEGLTGHPTMTDTFGDAMAHIEWAKWAEVVCVAPLTANTMAKLACGLGSDALTTVLMAIPRGIPIVLAPAMNTEMWLHPATQRNRKWLEDMGRYTFVEPIEKRLACGDVGPGGLAELPDLLKAIHAFTKNA
ncbi:MAG: phosphopantothenoylcysteine decarboxylase [Deltaproteobacteria bacterium]|jgi:phosphopantothenoylcysteine synthetase/decarboxylase|nr:phosphopantothenoylcysteine decarboxylase [Deltaproteobacteria bacterium]